MLTECDGCSRGFRRIPDASGFREGEAPAEPCFSAVQRLGRSLALPTSQSSATAPECDVVGGGFNRTAN